MLRQPHMLLLRYSSSVSPSQYAYDRDEVMALTAAYCDSPLPIGALETLLQDVKRHRRVLGGNYESTMTNEISTPLSARTARLPGKLNAPEAVSIASTLTMMRVVLASWLP